MFMFVILASTKQTQNKQQSCYKLLVCCIIRSFLSSGDRLFIKAGMCVCVCEREGGGGVAATDIEVAITSF